MISLSDQSKKRIALSSALIRRLIWPLLLLIVTAVAAPRAWAHANGLLQVSNQPIGPFETSVWTVPDPLQVEVPSHVTMVLLEPVAPGQAQQDFITDATVTVRAQPAGETEPQLEKEAILGADPAYPLFYESEIIFPSAGTWDVEVRVENDAGQGSRSFSVDVNPAPGIDLPLPLIIGGAVLILLALAFLFLRNRDQAASGATRE